MSENVLVYDSNPLKFLWQLRHRQYDVAVDTEQFHHFSAIFALRSRAGTRIGFKINPIRNPLYTHLVNYAPDAPEGEQFMRLLEPLGITNTCYDLESALANLKLELPAPVSAEIKAAATGRYAVVHAGASSVHKLWTPDNYVELAKLLHEKRGLSVVLVGGKGERRISGYILEHTGKSECGIISFAGDLDLETTAAVIKHAAVFVGSDSGLAHLAVALGIPTVVLFGPSDHLKWGFTDHHHAVVRADLPCSPCFIFGYHKPCRTISCMNRIKVEQVLLAVEKAI
jgi:ADP-heptose:LPS heptosyltransferase